MILRSLGVQNFGVFENAHFEFSSDTDRPIVLLTGNNGAGKTSILESLRLALHGRRAFDVPLSDAEYSSAILRRFRNQDTSSPIRLSLEIEYVDLELVRRASVVRSWTVRRQKPTEELLVTIDGKQLASGDADDLLSSIVPPEVARYFLFDGERIRDLADWEDDDETVLFAAVNDLLGLRLLDQLEVDLHRLLAQDAAGLGASKGKGPAVEDVEREAAEAGERLRAERGLSRKLRAAHDRARAKVQRSGAMRQDDSLELDRQLNELVAERRSLLDDVSRAAGDIMPLLCARTLRTKFAQEIALRREVEDRGIVKEFFEDHQASIIALLRGNGLKGPSAAQVMEGLGEIARGSLVPISASLPSLSRSEAVWMQRVIERELPEMQKRVRTVVDRLGVIDSQIRSLEDRKMAAPKDDPVTDALLKEFEERHRELVEHEARVADLQKIVDAVAERLAAARDVAKAQRLQAFQVGRIRVRGELIGKVMAALPVLSERMQESKQERFAQYLYEALNDLWHKANRLQSVEVSFQNRRIILNGREGLIHKRDLSAGEKQLFAVGFIYALARLSGRTMPFVIDTPLGRLDQAHRRRFVAEFLPSASHQVILLSTDTEIVGRLYDDIRPFIARHYELSDFNGGVTDAVQVASA